MSSLFLTILPIAGSGDEGKKDGFMPFTKYTNTWLSSSILHTNTFDLTH